ncbi:50S ribosomal protein L11 [Candidatus Dojkabacteria bacterium]|nr:50S ribosomal protein L11 [Candidatus Dojkabacteria bacterium]
MAKPIKAKIKLQIEGGKAVPGQKLGPTLGQHGVPIGDFVNRFNEMTKDKMGTIIPCILTVYEDRTFSIELKSPPAANLIAKAIGLKKGSDTPNKKKVGKISRKQLEEIAKVKMADLNTNNLDSATKIIEGTAVSMGLEIND